MIASCVASWVEFFQAPFSLKFLSQGFGTIDVDLMSLLHLSPRSIFDIGAGDGTYAEVESVLDETRRYTR